VDVRRTPLLTAALLVTALAVPASALLPDPPAPPTAARVVTVPVATQVTTANRSAATDLGSRVNAALGGSSAVTVAAAVEVDGLGTVLRRDAAHQLPPASTQKSFVAGAALLRLGAGTRFVTEVATMSAPSGGVVVGDLWLVPGGDPYLTTSGLRALARSVKAAGVTRVTGVLRLDDSRYDAKRRAEGWKPEWVPKESGPLSSFAVDKNQWRKDSAFLSDPAMPNAVKLRDIMRAEGISIGTITRQRRPSGATTVATVVSGPMSAVARRILKDSDNFAAELLLKEMGRVVLGANRGTSADGLAAVRSVLGAQGVKVGVGADGSGLSTLDRQNPDSEVALLRVLDASAVSGVFRAALPIACRDGTLKTRMCGTAAEGRASAKTGTVTGVRALAGYTKTRSGRVVRFAFLLTGVRDGTAARAAIDRAVVVLASASE
jgi:D-alanyl-D-alanine carboxypeptidase/D-alanyl-D-alanine-endopeptidase (penicillin-binding protein 4)